MKRVMTSLILLLLSAGSQDLYAMKHNKKKHRKKPQHVGAQNNSEIKGKNARKKTTLIGFIQSGDIKIPETSISEQPVEVLEPLFKALHSSVTVATPKKEAQTTYAHTRAILDELSKKRGDKKKAKEGLQGFADDFSDDEKNMKALWQFDSKEDIADPTKIYLGIMAGSTSPWKNHVYEYMKNKNQLCEKYDTQIVARESTLKDLNDQIVSLQKKAQEEHEHIQALTLTKEHHETKLKSAEIYSADLVDYLTGQIEETVGLIENYDSDLDKLDLQSSQLRKNKNTDVKNFNEQTSKNNLEKGNILTKKKEAETILKQLNVALEHVNQNLPKARDGGSFGRRYVWGKSF